MVYFLVGAIAFGLVLRWYGKRRRINKIYEYLREKVINSPEQTLNVTHTMVDLEALFGAIDEVTWDKLNDVRTGRKEIGYYEDDFLYWKKM